MEELVEQEEEKKYRKASYFWNTVAGMVNAAEAVVLCMIVTRTTGLEDAGVLTIAFAVGNLMATVGKYGFRSFQVTDARKQYRFIEYYRARIITACTMGLCTVLFLIYAVFVLEYSKAKCIAVATICVIYMVEAVEDVFTGAYQFYGRLDVGAKVFCARWFIILLSFLFLIVLTYDMYVSLVGALLLSIVVSCFLIRKNNRILLKKESRSYSRNMDNKNSDLVFGLLITTFPLFGISFLSFYLNNAPKYAIDRYLTDNIQACYGFVAMPVFIIGLLNSMIYQPTLVPLTQLWVSGNVKEFYRRAGRQIVIVVGITATCVAGAALIGVPVLSMLYHVDLTGYQMELLILQIAGCFLALSGYLSVLLTILRKQKALFAGCMIVAVCSVIMSDYSVRMFGTRGAAIGYLLTMVLLCVIYACEFLYYLRKRIVSSKKHFSV